MRQVGPVLLLNLNTKNHAIMISSLPCVVPGTNENKVDPSLEAHEKYEAKLACLHRSNTGWSNHCVNNCSKNRASYP